MASGNGSFWGFVILLAIAHFVLRVALGLGEPWLPDLLTLAALFAARRARASAAAAIGFVLGLLEDGLALTAFGARAIATTIAAYLGSRSRDLFEGDSLLFMIVYLFLGKWIRDAVVYLLLMVSGAARGDVMGVLVIDGALAALSTAGAGIVALLLYRALTGER